MAIEAIGVRHEPKLNTVRKPRIRGTFPGAKIELIVVERPSIAKIDRLQHTNSARKLWGQGYTLTDDRFLYGDNERAISKSLSVQM